MMKLMPYITILLSVFILNSCGNSKETAAMQDDTSSKQLAEPSGTYQVVLLANTKDIPQELTLSFEEHSNNVSGFSGCNNFFGTYEIDGNTISFSEFGSTKRLCKRFMDIEQNMLKSLAQVNNFTLEDKTLSLQQDDTILLKATKKTIAKIGQETDYTIEYTAQTRGMYKAITVKDNMVSIKKDRASNPYERSCSPEETTFISEQINTLKLVELNDLEAPSKAHQYDGAAIASLKITYNGETYQTPVFDHGKPNATIAELVNMLVSLTEKH